jgi:glutathione S-transferase
MTGQRPLPIADPNGLFADTEGIEHKRPAFDGPPPTTIELRREFRDAFTARRRQTRDAVIRWAAGKGIPPADIWLAYEVEFRDRLNQLKREGIPGPRVKAWAERWQLNPEDMKRRTP